MNKKIFETPELLIYEINIEAIVTVSEPKFGVTLEEMEIPEK